MKVVLGLREKGRIMAYSLEINTYELQSGWLILYLNDRESIIIPSDLVHGVRVTNTGEEAVPE